MRVLKFGGTSVANADRLKVVASIVTEKYASHKGICVIVSAFSGMTDLLLKTIDLAAVNDVEYKNCYQQFVSKAHEVAQELLSPQSYNGIKVELDDNHQNLSNVLSGVSMIKEASIKSKDYVVSFGERNCAFILATYLAEQGLPAEYLDARDCIRTDESHGAAIVNFEVTNQLLQERIDRTGIYIVTGFIGSTDAGVTTTLGRGGSDYTAAIVAAGLDADELEIWTDVDGVLTTNPRKVSKAYSIPELSYQEASEMSHYGAKVLYTPTIRPVKEKNIVTRIKNTFNTSHPGTLIHKNKAKSTGVISGLSSIGEITLLSLEGTGMQGVPGFASRFFKSMADGNINVIMITQASSEHSITVAINDKDKDKAKQLIEDTFASELERKIVDPVRANSNLCLLAIIGENMKDKPGVAGKLFQTLGRSGINIEAISQGSSELNITFAIKEKDETKALNCLHDAFFLSDSKTVHLYIVGVGLIGTTLMEQLSAVQSSLLEEKHIDLVVNGISNSRKMLFSREGIDTDNYKTALDSSDSAADIDAFINRMISDNHAHSIFVDNTASKTIPAQYGKILEANIAISTPNKIAMSSGLDEYKKLKAIASSKIVPFHFETNVGAGLPVISTIKDFKNSGDHIERIEAVLSGSLSYIFNNFDGQMRFSEVVKEAHKKGYTEPDPREDLSCADVKRKLLIVARESGFDIENEDIDITDILSQECLTAADVDAFYIALEKEDNRFKELWNQADAAGKRLRLMASYTDGRGKIELQQVNSTSPFYSLSGTDNMIVIQSTRYNETPLVVRGPGAGASVTAAGVLAEIITISGII